MFGALLHFQCLETSHTLFNDYDADANFLKIRLKDFKVKNPKQTSLTLYRELHSQDTSEVSVVGKAALTLSNLDLNLFSQKFSELEHCLLPAMTCLAGQVQKLSQESITAKSLFFKFHIAYPNKFS